MRKLPSSEWKGVLSLGSESTRECLLPHSQALSIRSPSRTWEIDLNNLSLDCPLKIEILKYIPNVIQKFRGSCKDSAYLSVKTPSVGDAAAALSLSAQKPLLAFLRDASDKEYLWMQGEKSHLYPLESLLQKNPLRSEQNHLALDLPFSEENLSIQIQPSVHIRPSSEENTPCVFALFSEANQHENIPLVYDPHATTFRWPLFQGKYSVRFQPLTRTLPFSVKLEEYHCSHPSQEAHTEKCQLSLSLIDAHGKEQKRQMHYGKSLKYEKGYILHFKGSRVLEVHYSPSRHLWVYLLLALCALLVWKICTFSTSKHGSEPKA